MKYKRLVAFLLGMVMTVETVPVFVFAKELDPAATGVISAEEEQAEETEETKPTVKETAAKKETPEATDKKPADGDAKEVSGSKDKAPADEGDKAEAGKEDKEPAQTEEKEPEQTEAEETAQTEQKEPEQTEDKEPAETEQKEPEQTEDKEPSETEQKEPTQTEDKEPSETGSEEEPKADETEPSVTDEGKDAGGDDKKPADAGESQDPVLQEGEVITEKDGAPYETHIPASSQDREKQFEDFFKKKAGDLINQRKLLRKAAPGGASNLSGNNLIAYNAFKSGATDVANGVRTSTAIEAPIADFNVYATSWTAAQLGVNKLTYVADDGKTYVDPTAANALRARVQLKISIVAVDNALLADCPYELYWFDKTKGVRLFSYSIGAKTIDGELRLFISKGPTANFCVSRDYCDDSSIDEAGRVYVTDPAKISKVNASIANAAKIVNAAKSKTDYQKLVYYYEQICSLVEYDHGAAGTGSVRYGDPWQIISVFDGNTSTNVVCEGYAKAFMYLCDLTSFNGDISCITVTGDCNGGHMWNVVNMENGKNYLVDVTNIDGRGNYTSAYFEALFLTGYTAKITNGYRFSGIDFYYDSDTTNTYSSAQISITNEKKYFMSRAVTVKVNGDVGGKATLSKTSALPEETVGVTATADDGYVFDHIQVYGSDIHGNKFTMTGTKADVVVYFKKIDYAITVTCGDHGSATVTPAKAGVGDLITVNTVPDNGYYVKNITVDGSVIYGKTFKMLAKPVTVHVEFDKAKKAEVGDELTDGINNYRVTNNADDGTGTVAFIGSANQAASVSVPATVDLIGINYKVTKIASLAFNKNATVTSVYIGANVTVIESKAFVGCPKLVKINGGLRLKTIGNLAVINCPKLSSFIITSAVLSKIGTSAFYGDKSLKTVYINKTTKLTKKGVKKSLKGSKVKTVKVKKSKVKKYKKFFTKKNAGRKVKVKK